MPTHQLRRLPVSALPQFYSDIIHMGGAMVVTVCVTALAAVNKVPADIVGAVYTGVIGYAAGRAGNVTRQLVHYDADPYVPHPLAGEPQD